MFRSLFIYLVFLTSMLFSSYAQENEPIQDTTLNNLILPVGYKTAAPDRTGSIKKQGKGKQTLILIPGWGFGADVYENFVRANGDKYTMYIVTLAGFGGTASPAMPDNAAYKELAWIKSSVNAILHLIKKEKLIKPVIAAHFSIGTQIGLMLALDHADVIGKVILMAGVPYRYYRPFEDTVWGKEARFTTDQRAKIVDQYWAPAWYKTVTKKTWDSGNHAPEEYSKDTVTGKMLFAKSARVPMPVMIRYLLEFFTYDASPAYKDIKIPLLVLLPSFSAEFLEGNYCSINQTISREWMKYYYLESWNYAREINNSMIQFKTVPGTHVFLWYDNPEQTYKAIEQFINEK